jgi:hypothetical protein
MTRKILSGLAAVAVLAALAHAPANAQQAGARTGQSAGINGAIGNGGARPKPQGPQQLGTGQRSPAAIDAATLLALSILRRKCLDNILPECP